MAKRISLREQFERAERAVVAARAYFDVWHVLKEEKTRRKYLDAMNEYPAFFAPVIEALFAALVVDLYSLVEDGSDRITLQSLWASVKAEVVVEEARAELIQARLGEIRVAAKPLHVLRHQYVAHKTATIHFKEVFRVANVTPNQIRTLTRECVSVLNEIMSAAGYGEVANGTPMAKQTEGLLSDLLEFHGLN